MRYQKYGSGWPGPASAAGSWLLPHFLFYHGLAVLSIARVFTVWQPPVLPKAARHLLREALLANRRFDPA
jgi:hypothetical protein